MVHELSQFDIPDRLLLANKPQTKAGMWTDIGEAKIINTIFGRANVRVVREQDKKRRAWLLLTLAATVLATLAWQGWTASRENETLPVPPLSSMIRVSPPAFEPEDISIPANSRSSRNNTRTPTQIVLDSMTTRREPPPRQPAVLKTIEQPPAKQTPVQVSIASKPKAIPPVTINNTTRNQADIQTPPKLADQVRPVVIAETPPVKAQPAEISPVVVSSLKDATVKEGTLTSPSPPIPTTIDTQPTVSADVQPKGNTQP